MNFHLMKNLFIINKTKHSTKEGNRKIQDERTQVVLTNKKSYEERVNHKGNMNKSSTQTKESYKESELLLGEHEQIKLPKQRILQKGGGNIKGTGIKSSTQAFPKS
jgi:hypothetical protein